MLPDFSILILPVSHMVHFNRKMNIGIHKSVVGIPWALILLPETIIRFDNQNSRYMMIVNNIVLNI